MLFGKKRPVLEKANIAIGRREEAARQVIGIAAKGGGHLEIPERIVEAVASPGDADGLYTLLVPGEACL